MVDCWADFAKALTTTHLSIMSVIKKLLSLLSAEQKRSVAYLQFLVIVSSMIQTISVASIGYFIALNSGVYNRENSGFVRFFYSIFDFADNTDFIVSMGYITILILLLSTVFGIFNGWVCGILSAKLGMSLSSRLYIYYLHESWLFHTLKNSSHFAKAITADVGRVTGIISNIIGINSKVVLIISMSSMLIFVNPHTTLILIGVFAVVYVLLYKFSRQILEANGRRISELQAIRYRVIFEGFYGIKDVLLLGCQSNFSDRFVKSGNKMIRVNSISGIIGGVPRSIIELLANVSVISIIIYFLQSAGGNFLTILPTITFYALAVLKLLPAFQGIYGSIAAIRGNVAALEDLQDDLLKGKNTANMGNAGRDHPMTLCKNIAINNITFTYPNKEIPAIDDLSLNIKAHTAVGIVGASGAGKTTLIDLLLGLLQPKQGEIIVDGTPLHAGNIGAWQATLGCVPQDIFLSDGSIRQNIAFGIEDHLVDEKMVKSAASWAHLDELIASLALGVDTIVGEHGVQLSGGQRQRVGIARALYYNASVILLDEATSSLDGLSEKVIMDSINDFSGKKTIIIVAHRLNTVKKCDVIYMMDNGKIIAHGSYEELRASNALFQKMLQYA